MQVSLSCLWSGSANKIDGCQSAGAKQPWYSMAPGNKFDLPSFICKLVRQTYIICQITNVDAMIGQVSVQWSMIREFAQGCQVRFPDTAYFGQLRRKCMLVFLCELQFEHDGSSTSHNLAR